MHGPVLRLTALPCRLEANSDSRNHLLYELPRGNTMFLGSLPSHDALVSDSLQHPVLVLRDGIGTCKELLSLGPKNCDFATAEATTAPQEAVRRVDQVNDGACVIQRGQETQNNAAHLQCRLAGHQLRPLGTKGGEAQIDEVCAGVGLSFWIRRLQQQSIPEPEYTGRRHIRCKPPHEGTVEDGGEIKTHCRHALVELFVVVGNGTFQEVYILYGPAATHQLRQAGVLLRLKWHPVVLAVDPIRPRADESVQEPEDGALRGLGEPLPRVARRRHLLVALWQEEEESQH
mmetsp:Transcript_65664/g.153650  ORF Transcript_65664/g.153650 Transcript_65664/m.153650 type:complete len:288 (-) Transcript_65664:142-1005(-)